jgi:transposase
VGSSLAKCTVLRLCFSTTISIKLLEAKVPPCLNWIRSGEEDPDAPPWSTGAPVEDPDGHEYQFFNAAPGDLKEEEVLLFLDGVHPQHNTKCSRAWIKIGEQKQIKSNSGRRRLNISGAYDPISQDILVREDKTINAETVMAFFKQIEAAYPSKASIYVIADQAPYYQNKDVKKYLETSRVELIALPTYSPNLNLIERLWKLMRKKVINNIYYEKFADFKRAILAFFSNDSLEFKAELRLFIGLDLHLLHSP